MEGLFHEFFMNCAHWWDNKPPPGDWGLCFPLLNRGVDGLMVGPVGVEPTTCGLRVRCSTTELEAQRQSITEQSYSHVLDFLDI